MSTAAIARKRGLSNEEVANSKAKRLMDTIAFRAAYYRANPQRFVKEYLGINLRLFQSILIYIFNYCNYAIYMAARGQGKTFLTALFCCVRCILYPGTKICVASATRVQGNEVLLKIQDELMQKSPNLKYEILKCDIGVNNAKIMFKNGSWIKVVTASDSGRGNRANVMIVDEFVKVDLGVITTVLKKFLTASREPGFLSKKKYTDYPKERNKEIYMSSAWMKSHWSYNKVRSYFAQLMDDTKKYFVCGLPYQLSIKEGLLEKSQVEDEMSEADFNEITWEVEMECLFYGDNESAFFKYEDISKRRSIKTCIYPPSIETRNRIPELATNERRIISLDVALLASTRHNNDASSIFINSAIPTSKNNYIANFIYTENYEGLHTNELALIIRRLFEQYSCTDLVIDTNGVGLGVYDQLVQEIPDPLYGTVYAPICACNDDMMAARCSDPNAPRCIWSIKATADFNSRMYLLLREGFKQGYINLLVNEMEAEELFRSKRNYSSLDAYEKVKMKMPYVNTTLLISELINLQHETKGTNIKVSEKSGMRKDRVSSIGYNYYVMKQLELKLRRSEQKMTYGSMPFFVSNISF